MTKGAAPEKKEDEKKFQEKPLIFDSSFESGNLGKVERLSEFEYDLYINPDTLNVRYRLWFYFSVQSPSPKIEQQRILFNVVNFSKSKSLFREGMTPLVCSRLRPRWQRLPQRTVYYYKCPRLQNSYVLSWVFAIDRTDDVFYFAYSFPYTYTDLQCYLHSIDRLQLPHYARRLATRTEQERRVDLLTITSPENLQWEKQWDEQRKAGTLGNFSNGSNNNSNNLRGDRKAFAAAGSQEDTAPEADVEEKDDPRPERTSKQHRKTGGKKKKGVGQSKDKLDAAEPIPQRLSLPGRPMVFVTARVHPGESPASYVVQGLIDFLLQDSPELVRLRDLVIFKVVPMLNPDGVFLGNYRCSSMGIDMNRYYFLPTDTWLAPPVGGVKEILLALEASEEFNLEMLVDIHSHSTALNSFMFCNNSEAEQVEQDKLFPRIFGAVCEDFSCDNTRFDNDESKKGSARRTISEYLPHTSCYTLETSFFCGTRVGLKMPPYGQEDYLRLGAQLGAAFVEYYFPSPKLLQDGKDGQIPQAGSRSTMTGRKSQ